VSRLSGALACELSQRLRVPVRIGIGEVQERLDRAPHSRRTADQALRALLFGTSSLACARAADLADSVALLHFLDALRESVPPVQTPVGRLVAYADAKGESVLLDTLRAFVENQADRSRAAEARAVHRNTFNHRLDKTPVRECGIDLKDPDALLLAQLQLRLLSHHDAGWD
jgi:DNA-binding PucR family transcriptional regulator